MILGVDELMDMARTMVNLVGNCLATAVMARWEGELGPGDAGGRAPAPRAAAGHGGCLTESWSLTSLMVRHDPRRCTHAALMVSTVPHGWQSATRLHARSGRRTEPPADGAPRSAPLTNLRYAITFDSATAQTRTIKVAMSFDVRGPGPVLLSFPRLDARAPTS